MSNWVKKSKPENFGKTIKVRCRKCKVVKKVSMKRLSSNSFIACNCGKPKKINTRKVPIKKFPDFPSLDTSGECFYGESLVSGKSDLTKYFFTQWIGYRDDVPFITVRSETAYEHSFGFFIETFSLIQLLESIYDYNIKAPKIFVRFKQAIDLLSDQKTYERFPRLVLLMEKIQPIIKVYNGNETFLIRELLMERAEKHKQMIYGKKYYKDWTDLIEPDTLT